jgi:hypothetical protein
MAEPETITIDFDADDIVRGLRMLGRLPDSASVTIEAVNIEAGKIEFAWRSSTAKRQYRKKRES